MEALKGIEVILDHTAGYKFIFLEYILVFFYNVLFNIIFYLQGKPRGQLALFASQTASPSKKSSLKKSKSDLSLRDRLTQQLVSGQAECMVCLEKIRPKNATWHCDGECYQGNF